MNDILADLASTLRNYKSSQLRLEAAEELILELVGDNTILNEENEDLTSALGSALEEIDGLEAEIAAYRELMGL